MAATDLHDSPKSPESSLDSPFHRLKFRHLVVIAILALAASYATTYFLYYLNVGYEIAWQVGQLAMWVVLLGLVVWSLKRAGTDYLRLFGRIADFDLWLVCKATFFLFVFASGSAYLITHLAHLLFPSLVETWFEQLGSHYEEMSVPFPLIIMPLVTTVLLGPITEEVVVRGALLHRLAVKWGIGVSLILSALIFAAYHQDVLGFVFLFAFGLVMSVIYIKTRSLLVPIACHVTFNLVWSAHAVLYLDSEMSLSEYLEFSWFYIALFLVSTLWIVRFLSRNWPRGMTPTPYYAEDTEVVPPEVTKRQTNTLYSYVAVMLMAGMILLWQSASPDPPPDFPASEDLPPGYHRIICPSGEVNDYPPDEWPLDDLPCAVWPCAPRGYHRIICPSGGMHDYPPDEWPFTEWPCTGRPCF